MNTSLSLRSAQLLTAATSSTSALRTMLLGGLAVLGSAGSALAQDAPSVKAKADAQSLALTVENPQQERMHVQVICLDKYACLLNEVNRKPSYGTKLNFDGVPAGQYAVVLRVGHERYRYTVQVQAKAATTISVRELAPATPAIVASAGR
ncbi:hypothetical protein [Hymenobacter rubidus]|uniref:hypothetical protein n=1 Tax=Hymenobacter rubidus TaxID=1441626 RepID=UPI00191F326F|nr:hypothetical protein [Hymenobacter rubidus]